MYGRKKKKIYRSIHLNLYQNESLAAGRAALWFEFVLIKASTWWLVMNRRTDICSKITWLIVNGHWNKLLWEVTESTTTNPTHLRVPFLYKRPITTCHNSSNFTTRLTYFYIFCLKALQIFQINSSLIFEPKGMWDEPIELITYTKLILPDNTSS